MKPYVTHHWTLSPVIKCHAPLTPQNVTYFMDNPVIYNCFGLYLGSTTSCTAASAGKGIYAAGREAENKVWSYFKVDLVNKKYVNVKCGRTIREKFVGV